MWEISLKISTASIISIFQPSTASNKQQHIDTKHETKQQDLKLKLLTVKNAENVFGSDLSVSWWCRQILENNPFVPNTSSMALLLSTFT